jgi:O-antigen ligase
MRARRLAVLGGGAAAIALLLIGWAQLSAWLHSTDAGSYSRLIGAVTLSWLIGVVIGGVGGRPGVAVVALAVMAVVAVSFASQQGSLTGHALSPPLHYGNADGAYAAAAVGAGAVLMALRVPLLLRVVGGIGAAGFLVVCQQTNSVAAEVGAVMMIAAAVIALLSDYSVRRWLLAAGPVAVVLAAALTAAVGAAYQRGQARQPLVVRSVTHLLTTRRVTLWHDAADIAVHHPVSGVGPGGFATTSPTARIDHDARWAHSVWLQQVSEQGIVGLVLLAAAVGVGWWLLLRFRTPPAAAVAASWAVAGLLLQASIDYVLHFAAVPLTVAALAGAATTGLARGPARAGAGGRHSRAVRARVS